MLLSKKLRNKGLVCLIMALTFALIPITTMVQAASKPKNPRVTGSIENNDIEVTYDLIEFGKYWQVDTNGDGKADKKDSKTPIVWRVLNVNGNDAYVVANQILDVQQYSTSIKNNTWEKSKMRKWLNSTFMKNAFTKTQQKAIKTTKIANKKNQRYGTKGGANTKDKIFLLSLEDITKKKYGFTNYDFKNGNGSAVDQSNYCIDEAKTRVPTQFVQTGKDTATGSSCYQNNWWLRSPGGSSTTVSYVGTDGSVIDAGWLADIRDDGVCPAMHIDLSKAKYKLAGIVICGG